MKHTLLAVTTATLLTACGGSGNGGNDNPTPTPDPLNYPPSVSVTVSENEVITHDSIKFQIMAEDDSALQTLYVRVHRDGTQISGSEVNLDHARAYQTEYTATPTVSGEYTLTFKIQDEDGEFGDDQTMTVNVGKAVNPCLDSEACIPEWDIEMPPPADEIPITPIEPSDPIEPEPELPVFTLECPKVATLYDKVDCAVIFESGEGDYSWMAETQNRTYFDGVNQMPSFEPHLTGDWLVSVYTVVGNVAAQTVVKVIEPVEVPTAKWHLLNTQDSNGTVGSYWRYGVKDGRSIEIEYQSPDLDGSEMTLDKANDFDVFAFVDDAGEWEEFNSSMEGANGDHDNVDTVYRKYANFSYEYAAHHNHAGLARWVSGEQVVPYLGSANVVEFDFGTQQMTIETIDYGNTLDVVYCNRTPDDMVCDNGVTFSLSKLGFITWDKQMLSVDVAHKIRLLVYNQSSQNI